VKAYWNQTTICPGNCGDGIQITNGLETACDDGNNDPGDGCSADCMTVETGFTCTKGAVIYAGVTWGRTICTSVCGDSKMVGTESCDDGGTGCLADCTGPKPGYFCSGGSNTSATVCVTDCGDGIKFGSEACDDGGINPGDGCSATCTVETGWTCDGLSPTTCTPTCGSSSTHLPETCDDGSNDG